MKLENCTSYHPVYGTNTTRVDTNKEFTSLYDVAIYLRNYLKTLGDTNYTILTAYIDNLRILQVTFDSYTVVYTNHFPITIGKTTIY